MTLDAIHLRGIAVHARHGVREEERRLGQRFLIDVTCSLDTRAYAARDDYGRAVCYGRLHEAVVEVATGRRFRLIEALGDAIALRLLAEFSALESVAVEVRKPGAPIEGVLDHVAVTIVRRREDLEPVHDA